MKIMENDIVRDMTAEEEAAFIEEHENMPAPWEDTVTADEALNIILGGGGE